MTNAKKCSHCTTSFRGKCLLKSNQIFSFFGDLDELNVVLGLAKAFSASPKLKKILREIQTDLIQVGGAVLGKSRADFLVRRVSLLEREIAGLKDPKLKQFVLPGRTKVSAFLHLARVVTRRGEREMVGLLAEKKIKLSSRTGDFLVQYLNHLSSYLFWLAEKYSK